MSRSPVWIIRRITWTSSLTNVQTCLLVMRRRSVLCRRKYLWCSLIPSFPSLKLWMRDLKERGLPSLRLRILHEFWRRFYLKLKGSRETKKLFPIPISLLLLTSNHPKMQWTLWSRSSWNSSAWTMMSLETLVPLTQQPWRKDDSVVESAHREAQRTTWQRFHTTSTSSMESLCSSRHTAHVREVQCLQA